VKPFLLAEKMITQEELKKHLHYDSGTGIFTRIITSSTNARKGSIAGGPRKKDGYIRISVGSYRYYAHRLVFLYMEGEFPKDVVDHINGNPRDNRWINLRKATHSQNLQNLTVLRKNKSGFTGVSWFKKTSKWRAQCSCNGIHTTIGYFDTKEEAHFAYIEFAKKNHGEFFSLIKQGA
jgi:hypothetical protein